MRGLAARAFAVLLALAGPANAGLEEAEVTILSFDDLPGWDEDDHTAALAVFLETCTILDDPQWRPICNLAEAHAGPAKQFFELFFRPVLIEDDANPLFTAYYEPRRA
jgi:peptidoglycan lytic transglycosylase A